MLIIAKGRPIEIRCYAIAADGNQMIVQEGEDVLFSLISSGVIVGADYITDEVDKHGEPYFRILIEKWYTLDKLTPGAYSIKLKIGERKMRLTDVFSIDRNKKNDNTGLQEGDKVVIRLTVKETPTGTITWAEDITVPGTLECIRVNGSNFYMDDRSIELPDYPSHLSDLEEDEGHRLMTDEEKQQLLRLVSLIPAEASPQNEIADKAYVDEEIRRAVSQYRGTNTTAVYLNTFLRWANSLEHDINDFVFWQRTDAAGNIFLEKYVFDGDEWRYEYKIVSTHFSAAEWAAIRSGITSERLIEITDKLEELEEKIDDKPSEQELAEITDKLEELEEKIDDKPSEQELAEITDKLEELEEKIDDKPSEQELAGKLDNTPTGAHDRPIYIKETEEEGKGEAEEIDSLDLPGDIKSQRYIRGMLGVSAGGAGDLSLLPSGGGGATDVVLDGQTIVYSQDGVVDLSQALVNGFEEFVPNRPYARGEEFKILGPNGYWTAYRVEAEYGMAAGATPDYGKCERITVKKLANPLDIGSKYINSLN